MRVYVLLYKTNDEDEGIHSIEMLGETIVLMFENSDDAERYCGLLEAQDFPLPQVAEIDREEIEEFCIQSDYKARFVEDGFVPSSQEDRLLLVPPEQNKDITNWNEDKNISAESSNVELEELRRRLEGLL